MKEEDQIFSTIVISTGIPAYRGLRVLDIRLAEENFAFSQIILCHTTLSISSPYKTIYKHNQSLLSSETLMRRLRPISRIMQTIRNKSNNADRLKGVILIC